MEKILILGAGYTLQDLIIKAKEHGMYTIAVDGNAQAVGAKYADEFYHINVTDSEGILQLAKEQQVDGISFMITEKPMKTVRYVCDQLGLIGPSWKSVLASLNKGKMREYFAEYQIPSPGYQTFNNKDEAFSNKDKLNFPAVIKPTNSAGQIGLFKVLNWEQYQESIHSLYSEESNKEIIVEDFMDGFEINVVVVIENGKIKFLTVSDRVMDGEAFGIAVRHEYPSKITYAQYIEVAHICKQLIEALEIKTAILYPQMMVTKHGVKIIEIGERIPGGQMTDIFEHATGYNLVDLQLDIAMGIPLNGEPNVASNSSVVVEFINSNSKGMQVGKVKEIKGEEALKHIEGIKCFGLYDPKGDMQVSELKIASDRFYYITAVGHSIKEAKEAINEAYKRLEFIFE